MFIFHLCKIEKKSVQNQSKSLWVRRLPVTILIHELKYADKVLRVSSTV